MKKSLLFLSALVLGLGLLLAASPAGTAAPAAASSAAVAVVPAAALDRGDAPAARRGREPLSRWNCAAWRQTGGSTAYRYCAKLTSIKDKVKIDYRERIHNDSNGPVTFKCTHAKTTTWTFGASVTGEVEAGVIFSKVKMSATASVSRAAATTRSTEGTMTVPRKSWAHCERGLHGYTFTGVVRRQLCGTSGCRNEDRQFTGSAPEAGYWKFGNGRGGVEITP